MTVAFTELYTHCDYITHEVQCTSLQNFAVFYSYEGPFILVVFIVNIISYY